MTVELSRDTPVNHKRVSRLMKELGLSVRSQRRWVCTTDSDHGLPVYPNLLKNLVPERINQVWVADLTYIALARGFVYLAVILDIYSRKVIGWALATRMTRQLTLGALEMALEKRGPVLGCIHHSDRGSQYAANDYVERLKQAGLRPSMSRRGNPYDNAYAESFMKTLKVEEVYLTDYANFSDVINRVPRFIEAVYNEKRLHSSLGYRSPNNFEVDQQPKAYAAMTTTA